MSSHQLSPAETTLMQAVDSLHDDMLDFTRRLVAEPSTLGNEAGAVNMMAAEMEKFGLAPERVPIDPEALADHPGWAPVPWSYEGRENVVAVRPADAEGGKSALFNGHLDVVSPEPSEYWSTDPFDPVVKDGRIYGRGAADMKGGVAAMSYAIHAVNKAGFGLTAPVTLEAVIEEECCGNGALACRNAGYDAEAVLIPEPFGPTILTHQLGVLWFRIVVKGKPVHVLEAGAGANALEKLYPVIAALREMETEMNEAPPHPAYKDIPHPLNLNIGIINGGDWPSTVAAKAEMHGRMAYYPGTRFSDMKERLLDVLARVTESDPWLKKQPPEIGFYGFRSDGHSVKADHPVLSCLSDCHRGLTGSDPAPYIATCTTDLRAFFHFSAAKGACYGPVGADIHGADEWVDMDSIRHTARAYALFLARWCGLIE